MKYIIVGAPSGTVMGMVKDTPNEPNELLADPGYMELIEPRLIMSRSSSNGQPIIGFFSLIGNPSVMIIPGSMPYYEVEDEDIIKAYDDITGPHLITRI